jgi:3-hydroxymyristoyl/3-hydroxydecanoyl-(acyl carrier protein) dehydratase
MDDKIQQINQRLQNALRASAQRASALHGQFLDARQQGVEQLGGMLAAQIAQSAANSPDRPGLQPPAAAPQSHTLQPPSRPRALFEAHQMEEFALRSMAKCFGPEFLVFEGRRHPRIPNRDLMLMSRALEINGQRLKFDTPSSIVVEYDVPADAWFFRDNAYPFIPYSVWMEIALQPCGFLSAYLGTSLKFPEVDYYFRNLDGNTRLLSNMDLRGKTITTRAKLTSTIISDTTIIQKFEFTLSCGNVLVFEGGSIFGFFPPETMANQAGLDTGKKNPSLFEKAGSQAMPGAWLNLAQLTQTDPARPHYHISHGQMNYLDKIYFAPRSATQNEDYLYGEKNNHISAWFYACHFHEDPVMPGSLGIEAILQTIQAYAVQTGLGKQLRSPRFEHAIDQRLSWKYRGQILPSHKLMKVEVKIKQVEQQPGQVTIRAEASLWADTMRIYEVKNIQVRLEEA